MEALSDIRLFAKTQKSRVLDLVCRSVPAVVLFALIKSVDFIDSKATISEFLMEALLIIPILLPFFRFGLPIHLQQALSFKKKVQAKDNLFWFQLVIFLSIQPLYFVNLTAYLILSLTVISALLFNLGCFYIREGKRPGFIIQNGLVNGSLLIAVCLFILKPENTNIFHFIMIEIFVVLLITFYLYKPKAPDLIGINLSNIKPYLVDSLTTFLFPLVTYFTLKNLFYLSVDFLLLLKISAFISGSIGALILIRVKQLDHNEGKTDVFNKIKLSLLNVFYILSSVSMICVAFLVEFKLLPYFIILLIFEFILLKFGHFNILLNYKASYNTMIKISVIVSASLYLFNITLSNFNVKLDYIGAIIFYLSLIGLFHYFCFKYNNA